MRYIDKSDCMTKSYSMEMDQKLFFRLLDLSILNSFILLTSCGLKFLTEISDLPSSGI
jgi:hypothetical protein